MDWKNIYINSNLIRYSTGNAYLIGLPKDKRAFWITSKCVHFVYTRDDIISIGYTDEFNFKLSDGTFLTAKEFEEIFEKMDSNIRPFLNSDKWSEEKEIDIIHTPEILTPIENPTADKELIDD
jgi:hypothetical protein